MTRRGGRCPTASGPETLSSPGRDPAPHLSLPVSVPGPDPGQLSTQTVPHGTARHGNSGDNPTSTKGRTDRTPARPGPGPRTQTRDSPHPAGSAGHSAPGAQREAAAALRAQPSPSPHGPAVPSLKARLPKSLRCVSRGGRPQSCAEGSQQPSRPPHAGPGHAGCRPPPARRPPRRQTVSSQR